MKRNIILSIVTLFAVAAMAKDIKTVVFTTTPQMHCDKCESKIKNSVRFVRGVKSIETIVERQTVTIKYDADKTSPEKIREGFTKVGYTVKEAKTVEKQGCCAKDAKTTEKQGCCSKDVKVTEKQSCCGEGKCEKKK